MCLLAVVFAAPGCNRFKSCTEVEVRAVDGRAEAKVKVDGETRAGVAVDFKAGEDLVGTGDTDAAGVARPSAELPAAVRKYTAAVDPFAQEGELREVCPAEDSASLRSP